MPSQLGSRSERDESVRAFILVGLALAIPAVVAHWRLGKFELHLLLNNFHPAWGDRLFPWLTFMASGWMPLFVALVLLWKNWRSFLMVALSCSLSAILVQVLKHWAFSGHHRPLAYLEQMPGLHLVAGLELHRHFSFPSGHTTAAFQHVPGLGRGDR